MTTATFGGSIVGPGGASFLIGDRGPSGLERPTDHLVFHGVRTDPSFHRALYVDDLVWDGPTPHVVLNR